MSTFEELYKDLAYPGKIEFVKAARSAGLDPIKAADWLKTQSEQQVFLKPVVDKDLQKDYKFRMNQIENQYDLTITVDLMDMTRFFKSND